MKKQSFTENQRKAISLDNNLSVTANAGAGKTTVLAHRFIRILLRPDVRIGEVVAITFTEKAASELRNKIAEYVTKRIREQSGSREELRRLEQIRDQLSSAVIGTIHSFCAQLLREYPIEAGVDAAFTVLEGSDQRMLIQDSVSAVLERLVAEGENETERVEVINLLRMLGRRTVEAYVSACLERRELMERFTERGGCFEKGLTDTEILSRWDDSMEHHLARFVDDTGWRSCLHEILPRAEGRNVPQVRMLLEQWRDDLPLRERREIFERTGSLIFTSKPALLKAFVGSGNAGLSDSDPNVRHLCSHWKSYTELTSDDAAAGNRILLKSVRVFLSIYEKAKAHMEDRKREQGQLDFEDLQLKARALLQEAGIKARLSEKYRYLMVDEFQDTNRLQYDIVKGLSDFNRPGSLFIVGDPKQSIYGFRNAEVEVFGQASQDLKLHGENGQSQTGIILSESFRPLGTVAAFVNHLFSQIMGRDPNPFSVEYEELVRGRATDAPGRVELLLTTSPEGEFPDQEKGQSDLNRRTQRSQECELVAVKLKDLKSSGAVITGEEKDEPFSFSHAAILLRSRTHLEEIERALKEHDVPYRVSGGIGFYQKQEVSDLLNYFKFLLNQDDDVALAGILRSPLFVLSDAELFEISLMKRGRSFWEKLQAYAQTSALKTNVAFAVKTLSESLLLANRLSIPLLVQKVLRQTGWRATMAGMSTGSQAVANIEKLLRIARDFEGRGLTSLFDFVERLSLLAEDEVKEGEALVDAGEDCVHIMTIHAAKGLEFPVVFLPFLHDKQTSDTSPYFDPQLGMAFKVRSEADFDEEIKPPLYQLLRQRANEKSHAEEKRIFYVGCTRARDMLFLSGQFEPGVRKDTCLSWVMHALGCAEGVGGASEIIIPTTLKILRENSNESHIGEVPFGLRVQINSPNSNKTFDENGTEILQDLSFDEVHIDPLEETIEGEYYSATQMRTFLECPSKYYLRYRLGIPEQHLRPTDFDAESDSDDSFLGEMGGMLAHLLLQSVISRRLTDDQIAETAKELVYAAMQNGEEERKRLLSAILMSTSRFLGSEIGREVIRARDVRAEYAVQCSFRKNYLSGVLDCLYTDGHDRWCILDYKTDFINGIDLAEKGEIYKPQLLFYAYLICRLFEQDEVKASLVFLRDCDHPVRFTFGKSDFHAFESVLLDSITRIQANQFGREERCKDCPYEHEGKCLIAQKMHFAV